MTCIRRSGALPTKFPIHTIYFSDLFAQLDKLLTFACKMAKIVDIYS